MDRVEVFDLMAALKLYGMRAAKPAYLLLARAAATVAGQKH
jgi:hypothetical protein